MRRESLCGKRANYLDRDRCRIEQAILLRRRLLEDMAASGAGVILLDTVCGAEDLFAEDALMSALGQLNIPLDERRPRDLTEWQKLVLQVLNEQNLRIAELETDCMGLKTRIRILSAGGSDCD